jgi:hypothetical protein
VREGNGIRVRAFTPAIALAIALVGVFAGPSAAATAEVVDGLATGGGRVQARIAGDTAAIVKAGIPWVFYGANPEYGYQLRAARLGSPPTYRTIDGAGGSDGRTTHSVATDVSAVSFGAAVHVFYRDETSASLRHPWRSDGTWSFQTLDGDSTIGGRTRHDVGLHSAAIVYRDRVHVFSQDATTGDVRHAVYDGTSWRFSILDGNGSWNGRTTARVGDAIAVGIWGSRLRVLYTGWPSDLRLATRHLDGSWGFATISSDAVPPVALRTTSGNTALIAYGSQHGIAAGRWNGSAWAVDLPVSDVETVTGLTIFLDGGTPFVGAGISQCYGSGGCDRLVGVGAWNGSSFDDPYFGGPFVEFGEPPGDPSSAVTIGGRGRLFVGGFGYRSEPDIYDQVLLEIAGPF